MMKIEAMTQIQSSLQALSSEQLHALAELTQALARSTPPEDAATISAIEEGVAQARRGEFASAAQVDELLNKPWT